MMLLDATRSGLLVIDVQEKLLPAIDEATRLVASQRWLIAAAQLCGVPVWFSEQYPQALGATLPCLREAAAADAPVFSKTAFSCVAAGALPASHLAAARQWVLCGIEAHVCVLQTALDLTSRGETVFVVADAVGSRSRRDVDLALERMARAGVILISREMALFEWLRDSRAPAFKAASKMLLQQPVTLPFAAVLATLPSVTHLSGLKLLQDGQCVGELTNRPGEAGSLAIYHALWRRFGAITPEAAQLGLTLYAEHGPDAVANPGKHPNIDRLIRLAAGGAPYQVELLPAC